jgi:hypothetical protein
MGITNIRSAHDLISRGHSMPCLMPELGCSLILDGSADTDLDLARYTPRLSRGLSDQWITFDAKGNTVGTCAVSACNNPRVHISEHIRAYHRSRQDLGGLGSGVVCFLVVEGVQGARTQKLVVRGSLAQIAELAFFEAANGFNVVFGGLLLKRQLAVLGGTEDMKLSFVRVKNVGELLEKDGGGAPAVSESGEPVWVCY